VSAGDIFGTVVLLGAAYALAAWLKHLKDEFFAWGDRLETMDCGKEARHPEGRGREATSGSEPRVAPGHVRTHDESVPTR
jgi:hypothetical protein